MQTAPAHVRRRQAGVATLEFALMLMFGLLPLLLLTYSGVMVMAAQQTLSLASAEGARASLRFGLPEERREAACAAAQLSMRWLLNFSGQSADCASASTGPIVVSAPAPCTEGASVQCIRVTVSYDYDTHPFLPGTARLYRWALGGPISSSAVAQLDLGAD